MRFIDGTDLRALLAEEGRLWPATCSRDCRPGRGRAGRGPPPRARPSRRQARQHPAPARRRPRARLTATRPPSCRASTLATRWRCASRYGMQSRSGSSARRCAGSLASASSDAKPHSPKFKQQRGRSTTSPTSRQHSKRSNASALAMANGGRTQPSAGADDPRAHGRWPQAGTGASASPSWVSIVSWS